MIFPVELVSWSKRQAASGKRQAASGKRQSVLGALTCWTLRANRIDLVGQASAPEH